MTKNPWAADSWNLTAQGAFVRHYGVAAAARHARMVGSALGATAPALRSGAQPEQGQNKLTVLVQRKNFTTVIGGGSSGNGSPLVAGLVTKV